MEKILLSHNRHWVQPYSGLYPRDLFQKLIKNLPARHIQVLQGVRRSGKSTLFKLFINYLIESIDPGEILYLNLEDPFFIKYDKMPIWQNFCSKKDTTSTVLKEDPPCLTPTG